MTKTKMISLKHKLSEIEQGCGTNKYNYECRLNNLCPECKAQKKLLLEVIELDLSLKKELKEGDDFSIKSFIRGYNQALKDILGEKNETK